MDTEGKDATSEADKFTYLIFMYNSYVFGYSYDIFCCVTFKIFFRSQFVFVGIITVQVVNQFLSHHFKADCVKRNSDGSTVLFDEVWRSIACFDFLYYA